MLAAVEIKLAQVIEAKQGEGMQISRGFARDPQQRT
jgi:hypothetical protein